MMNQLKKVEVNLANRYQIFEGFGTSLCWWAHIVGRFDMMGRSGKAVKEELMDLLFDVEKGLGMNIVRYNIGGGDQPSHHHIKRIEAKIPGYKVSVDSPYDYSADDAQLWVLKRAKEMLEEDLIVEIFSNSPPWWMTYSQCSSGHEDMTKDNLKPEYYEAFADYLVDVCLYIQNELNINIDYLNPLNEPESDYWQAFSTKQEGCHFSTGDSQSKMYEITFEALKRAHVENTIKLTGLDETSIDMTIEQLKQLSKKAIDVMDKVNTHAYGGSKRIELREQVQKLGKKLWMSEVCVGDSPHHHEDLKTALEISHIILKDLRELQATAWVMWQAIESEVENLLWNNCYGFIHAVYENQEDLDPSYHQNLVLADHQLKKGDYFLTKQYYAFAQFCKYIRPGYQFIDIDDELAVAAYSDKDNRLVIVVLNDEKMNRMVDLKLIDTAKEIQRLKIIRTSSTENLQEVTLENKTNPGLQIELIAESITTIIIDFE